MDQTENATGNENNQIIYVTYQDPNDPNGKQTLQMLSQMVFNLNNTFVHQQFHLFIFC